ncbi:MAG: helix-turn-helix domain-containing protein [Verrucomicrobiia bacterium]|jgi:excisionase family DNA binding protein
MTPETRPLADTAPTIENVLRILHDLQTELRELRDAKPAPPSTPLPTDKLAVGVKQACHLLSIGHSSLYKLIAEGRLHPTRANGRPLFPVAELQRFLETYRCGGCQ